jgi:hypothetical protein
MTKKLDDPTLVGRMHKGDYENLRTDFQQIVAKKIANKVNVYKEQLKTQGSFNEPSEE